MLFALFLPFPTRSEASTFSILGAYLALSLHHFASANPPPCCAAFIFSELIGFLNLNFLKLDLFSFASFVLLLAYPPCSLSSQCFPPCSDPTTTRLPVDFTRQRMCPTCQPVCLVSHALATAVVFWFCCVHVFLLYLFIYFFRFLSPFSFLVRSSCGDF